MPYRQGATGLQVRQAANIGGGHHDRAAGVECGQLVVAQAGRQIRLQYGIRSRRATAQMAVGNRGQLEASSKQEFLDHAA